VVASGLFNPRGIALDADGTLYIVEAGDAGTEAVYATPEAGTPAPVEPLTTHGPTGRVSKIAPDGTQSVVADGLPSYSFGPEVVGPSGIAVANGTLYVAVGGPGPLTAVAPPVPNRDSVVAIDPATGAVTTVADIGASERGINPDPHAVDSNLGGVAVAADGLIYVADAGGNAVYTVDPASGALAVLAVLPGLPSPGGAANPARGGAAEVDPVPTSLTPAPSGGVYVGLLSGAPFAPGSAKVLHVAPDGTVADAAAGLTMVTGVAVGPDDTIYASQLSENFLMQPPAAGSVVRIGPDGTPETVVAGLVMPYGIAVVDGAVYVAIHASAMPGTPPQGEVLRCELPAPTADVTIELVDIAFQPNAITIPANQDVTIELVTTGFAGHNFTIDELGIKSPNMFQGETATVTINAAPGAYTFYCSIPGHRAAGMIGTLTVQ
jgi:plastocyanin/sugar lactone lactonase YvrE